MSRCIPVWRGQRGRGSKAAQIADWTSLSPCDFAKANQYRWFLQTADSGLRYAVRIVNGKAILLHRFLLDVHGRGNHVDHVNGDGLNNTRENLRVCTHSENMQNRRYGYGTSSHRGVCWRARDRRWQASVKLNGRIAYRKLFPDEAQAAVAAAAARARLMPFSREARQAAAG